ncbi:MAG TPA: carbonic anhydrase [Alphaproteobacteria bacterium]|nr:carbonic anhydrase [Alphaproteobacteria bacterium]
MKKITFITASLTLLFCTTLVLAKPSSGEKELLDQIIKSAIRDLVEDNAIFAKSKSPEHFEEFQDIQNPRVTMVLCSDSRVQTNNFSKNGAENDIFVARNIGNQFVTTKGSVEFGVDVLKTPVLMIVGHSHCGAVNAARGDISKIAPAIQKELKTLDVKAAPDDKQAVVLNVNHQVADALATFKEKVDANKLAIIGAVYDFRDDYGYGKGQLIIVNLNGKKDPEEIKKSHYFDNMKEVTIGIQNEKQKKAGQS